MRSISIAKTENKNIRLFDDARTTHMHVLGISGQGKSYFLEHMIRQDIIAGHGVCVIDPHGELYDNVLRWILSEGLDGIKNIHLLNPSDKTYTFGFNPFCIENGTSLEYRVDAMVDACVRVWGGEDLSQTPRLSKCLTAVFHALAANKLSLAEARLLTNTQLRNEARALTEKLDNEEFRALWNEFLSTYNSKTFAEYFESTTSRLIRFVGNPVIKEIVGQTENVIDFKKCMDEGHIVLVNLAPSGQISRQASQLLGSLITNDLYTTAFTRDISAGKPRPFYCYIDECARYLTDDIVKSLDETRKYGLHMVLSHQRINQLRENGDDFYNAVMAGAQLKVVFNLNDEESADIMSRHLFRKNFDLELPKHAMDKPFTVGHELAWFESEAYSTSEIKGEGEGDGTGTALGAAMSQMHDSEGGIIGGYSLSDSTMDSRSSSSNRFHAAGNTVSHGRSEGLVPTIEFLPTELHKLDELIHLGMVELLSLPERSAYICSPKIAPMKVTTINVKPGILLPQFIPKRIEAVNEQSMFVSLRDEVREKIQIRAFEIECAEDANSFGVDDDDDGLGY